VGVGVVVVGAGVVVVVGVWRDAWRAVQEAEAEASPHDWLHLHCLPPC
jgi:hypothetical protein